MRPPHLVLPLTVEPSKPRLCNDDRFLNLWTEERPSVRAEARLKLYLKEAQIDEGETLHSFGSGSAVTLALSGSQLADIIPHVGWNNKDTVLYYMKLAEVLSYRQSLHLLSADC